MLKFNLDHLFSFQLHQVLKQITSFLIAVLLAKSEVSIDFIGVYESFLWIGFASTIFLISGLSETFLSKSENNLYQFYIPSLFISLVIFLLLFFLPVDIPYWKLFIGIISINFPTFLIELIWLKKENGKSIVVFSLITSIIQLGIVSTPLLFNGDPVYIFYGLFIFSGLKHFFLLIFLRSNFEFQFKFSKGWEWMIHSLPLIFYSLLGSMHIILDGALVQYFYPDNPEKFAIFRYGTKELPFSVALTASLGLAILPILKKDIFSGLDSLKEKCSSLSHLLFPVSILLIFFGKDFFKWIFNPEFIDSAIIFQIYLLLLIPRMVINKPILISKNDQGFILKIAIGEIILNLFFSIVLGYYYGLPGIAVGTLIAYCFEKIAFVYRLKTKFGVNFSSYTPTKLIFSYSIVLVAAFIFIIIQNF